MLPAIVIPAVIIIAMAAIAAIVWMAAAFDEVVLQIRDRHPSEWERLGRPCAYMAEMPTFLGRLSRPLVVAEFVEETPEWVAQDDRLALSVAHWRRVRSRAIGIGIVLAALLLLVILWARSVAT